MIRIDDTIRPHDGILHAILETRLIQLGYRGCYNFKTPHWREGANASTTAPYEFYS